MTKKKIKIEKETPVKIIIEATKNKMNWNYNCDISTFWFYLDRVKHLTQLKLDEEDNKKGDDK